MTKARPIRNLEDLRWKRQELRLQVEKHEQDLGESWKSLQANYRGMIWKEVNPFKGGKVLNMALDLIQPGLLPVIAEVAKGSVKGNPLNLKVLGSSLKYAAASFGIKWLRKWLDKKQEGNVEHEGDEQSLNDNESGEPENQDY
jgi:hypothetical protein